MNEPVTLTTLPRLRVDQLRVACLFRGMKPGDLTIRSQPEEWERLAPWSIIGVDEDGYVWLDRRPQRE